jgi:hypothetical protein
MTFQPTLFNQLLNLFPGYAFEKAVKAQKSDLYCKNLEAGSHFKLYFILR